MRVQWRARKQTFTIVTLAAEELTVVVEFQIGQDIVTPSK